MQNQSIGNMWLCKKGQHTLLSYIVLVPRHFLFSVCFTFPFLLPLFFFFVSFCFHSFIHQGGRGRDQSIFLPSPLLFIYIHTSSIYRSSYIHTYTTTLRHYFLVVALWRGDDDGDDADDATFLLTALGDDDDVRSRNSCTAFLSGDNAAVLLLLVAGELVLLLLQLLGGCLLLSWPDDDVRCTRLEEEECLGGEGEGALWWCMYVCIHHIWIGRGKKRG